MIGERLYGLCWLPVYAAAKVLAKWRGSGRWLLPERVALPPPAKASALWFHCASAGEAAAVAGLLGRLSFPAHRLMLTASTRQGVLALKQAGETHCPGSYDIRAAPLDSRCLMLAFAKAQRIRLLCLFEGEIWPNMLAACRRLRIPVLLVSGRIPQPSGPAGFATCLVYGHYWKRMDWVQAQDSSQAVEISRWRGGPVSAGCDLKVAHYLDTGLEKSTPSGITFTFVSIHFKELKIIKPLLPGLMRGRPVAVIPRYPSQFNGCFRLLEPLGFARFSSGARGGHVLVDALGETARFLRRSRCCFVGGSLVPRGGHNCWEPFLAGVPVLTGPWHFNQRELVDNLRRAGLARIVRSASDFTEEEWPRMLPEKRDTLLAIYRQQLHAAMEQIREKMMALGIPALPAGPQKPLPGG